MFKANHTPVPQYSLLDICVYSILLRKSGSNLCSNFLMHCLLPVSHAFWCYTCPFAGSIKPSIVSSKHKHKPSSETSTSIEPPKGSCSVAKTAKAFTFRELATATKNFRSDCLLGEGGFGRVYKGKLENGQVHTKPASIQTFTPGTLDSSSVISG